MTDSKMPERIWAWHFKVESARNEHMQGGWDDKPDVREAEYIRADLVHPAPVADAGLEALAETAVRNWLGEMEGFATRGERFFDAVQNGDDMMPWLVAAAASALSARTAQPVGVRDVLIRSLLQKHEAEMRAKGRNPVDYMSKWKQAADTLALLPDGGAHG